MAATNYTSIIAAQDAFLNAAARQGITPSTSISAQQLPMSVLANVLQGQAGGAALNTGAAAGITSGTGAIARSSVTTEGGLIITRLFVDMTGLQSSTTDLDIIGTGASPAFLARITSAESGTIIGGTITCLEAPATGVTTIDWYAATEGTGVFDGAVTSLTETVIHTASGASTLGLVVPIQPDAIAANDYIYIVNGAAGTVGTYTAGRFLLTLFGVIV